MEENLAGEATPEMDITFPFFQDIWLRISPVLPKGKGYPSSRLQKGLILISNGQELAEEGVGFGVPVLKQGVKTIFSGDIELTWFNDGSRQEIAAIFFMNLEERLTSQSLGTIKSASLYRIKNHLADLHRRLPLSRGPLINISNMLRSSFGWQTTFEDAGCNYPMKVNYSVDLNTKTIAVSVDLSGVPKDGVTEVILMNEQGAHYFDTYSDSNGLLLQGEAIGSWENVTSGTASFLNKTHQLAFTLHQINGASLYRGRELIGSRLAWSGFGYSLPPSGQRFTYALGFERLV